VVLGVGIGAGWFLRPASGPDASPAGQLERIAGTDVSAETSIAVLPFANMSADPEQEFFADGITEDILTRLAASASCA
jgi:adenylate cyclase